MSRPLPEIVIRAADEDRLAELANSLLDSRPELGEELLAELARARLESGDSSIANTVQMGTTVTYEAEGRTRQVTLVYPAEANIDAGCISVATPIGTALLGLAQGQSIEWTARDGRRQQLTILSVSQSDAAPSAA
jgi:regulator of nucleoside diphosphate kinase